MYLRWNSTALPLLFVCGWCLSIAGVFPGVARTFIMPPCLEELVVHSDAVVIGRVIAARMDPLSSVPSMASRVATATVELDVVDWMRGSGRERTLLIRFDWFVDDPGFPRASVTLGDIYLVFIARSPTNHWVLAHPCYAIVSQDGSYFPLRPESTFPRVTLLHRQRLAQLLSGLPLRSRNRRIHCPSIRHVFFPHGHPPDPCCSMRARTRHSCNQGQSSGAIRE